MKKITKRALASFLVLLMVLLMMPVMAFAEVQTFEVNNSTELVNAMSSANNGDIIELKCDIDLVTKDKSHTNDMIFFIKKNVTINGNNYKIYTSDGFSHPNGSTICFLEVSGGTVTFNKVVFSNECSETLTHAITTYGAATSSLVFNECTFNGTSRAISVRGDVIVDKCVFNTKNRGLQDDFGGLTSSWQITNSSFNCSGDAVNASSAVITKFSGNTLNDATINMSIANANGANLSGNIANSRNDKDQYIYYRGEMAKDKADIVWTFNEPQGEGTDYYFYDLENTPNYGYIEKVDGNTHTLTTPKVAKIGDKEYGTIAEAVEAAKDGDTITLLDDVAQDNSVVIDKDIILELNGKKITVDSEWKGAKPTRQALFYVKSGGKLTVNDSVGEGAIDGSNDPNKGYDFIGAIVLTISNDNDTNKNAVLVVNNGSIIGNTSAITTNGERHNTDITINGGAIIGNNPNDSTSIYHPDRGTLTITGGKFIGYDGIDIKGGSPVSITGGEFVATGKKVDPEEAQSSGSNSVGSALYVEGNYGYGAKVNISGGKFRTTDPEAPVVLSAFNKETEATISITGGYFSDKVDSDYVAKGYSVINTDDPVIKKAGYPYTIGHTVTFDVDGGKPAAKAIEVKHNGKVTKNDVITPSKDKNTFVGWVDEKGNLFSFDTAITENRTIKANWLPDVTDGKIVVKDTETGVKAETTIKKSDIPLSVEEVEAIKAGKVLDVNLIVKVEEAKEVKEAEKELIKESMEESQKLGMYLDCSMFKTLDGKPVGQITETLNPITIMLTVPEKLRLDGRVYSIVRVHNGEAETLFEGKADKDWKISFKTDKFSTYAILYEGGNPDTGDHNNAALFACLGGLALIGIFAVAGVMIKRRRFDK